MRRKLIYSLIIVFVISGVVNSQPIPPSKHERLKHLKEELNLSELQAKKISTILNSSQQRMNAIRDKMEEQRDEAFDEMDSVRAYENQQIQNVLDETQKEKFIEIKKEMERHHPPMNDEMVPDGRKRHIPPEKLW